MLIPSKLCDVDPVIYLEQDAAELQFDLQIKCSYIEIANKGVICGIAHTGPPTAFAASVEVVSRSNSRHI